MVDLNASDIVIFKSAATAVGISSLGGNITATSPLTFTLHQIFDKTNEEQANLGITKFRCLYIKNNHTTQPIRNPILVIPQNTISPNDEISIGWDPAGLNLPAQSITDQYTYPLNVTFVFGENRQNGAILGQNIPPQTYKAFWIRLNSRFGAQGIAPNAAVLRLLADNLVTEVIDQAPQPSPATSFTVIGETDTNQTLQDITNQIVHRNANFNVCVGNNLVDSTNAEDWFKMLGPSLAQITKLSFGQRDTRVKALINQYLNKYGLTNKYHSFTFQNCHFLFMDTSSSSPSTWDQSSEQHEFCVNDLTSASGDPTIDWIFVVMNRAMYASQTSTSTKYVLKSLRDIYHPLFEKHNVHCVLNGYFNNYQRQHCLHFNNSNSDNPSSILSGQAPNYVIPQGNQTFTDSGNTGCLFLTLGMGGVGHDNISTLNGHTALANSANFGYMLIDLLNDDTQRQIKFKFHNVIDNKLLDYFTITKLL